MVHALREAQRVLKPEALLVDLRPAALHRRVGVIQGEDYRFRWVMHEDFADDHAADRAVRQIVSEGLFKPKRRTRFPCFRTMDTLDEFQEWLTDFVSRGKCEPHNWLVERLERELATSDGIVVSAPLVLQTLRKRVR